jgi:hypothetical protein
LRNDGSGYESETEDHDPEYFTYEQNHRNIIELKARRILIRFRMKQKARWKFYFPSSNKCNFLNWGDRRKLKGIRPFLSTAQCCFHN